MGLFFFKQITKSAQRTGFNKKKKMKYLQGKSSAKMIKATFLHSSSKARPIKITCILKAEAISS